MNNETIKLAIKSLITVLDQETRLQKGIEFLNNGILEINDVCVLFELDEERKTKFYNLILQDSSVRKKISNSEELMQLSHRYVNHLGKMMKVNIDNISNDFLSDLNFLILDYLANGKNTIINQQFNNKIKKTTEQTMSRRTKQITENFVDKREFTQPEPELEVHLNSNDEQEVSIILEKLDERFGIQLDAFEYVGKDGDDLFFKAYDFYNNDAEYSIKVLNNDVEIDRNDGRGYILEGKIR